MLHARALPCTATSAGLINNHTCLNCLLSSARRRRRRLLKTRPASSPASRCTATWPSVPTSRPARASRGRGPRPSQRPRCRRCRPARLRRRSTVRSARPPAIGGGDGQTCLPNLGVLVGRSGSGSFHAWVSFLFVFYQQSICNKFFAAFLRAAAVWSPATACLQSQCCRAPKRSGV